MKKIAPIALYVFAISLLVISSTLAYKLARQGLEDRENDACVINIAGRQRMLSQRITKDCLELLLDSISVQNRQQILKSLNESLAQWELAHQQLHGQTRIGEFTVQNSVLVRSLFDSIEQPFQKIRQAANQIIALPNPNDINPISVILNHEPRFLEGMDEIVLQYQQESTASMRQLGSLETSIWIFTLVLLFLELFFIFIPLNRRIVQNMQAQDAHNRLLQEKQRAVENALALQQHLQQNLLEAEKLATLGEIVGVITHEINTPIGIAVTAASSLQEFTTGFGTQYKAQQMRKSDLEAYIEHAEEGSGLILSNLEKAARLLQDFKNIAVHQLSSQREVFDLSDLVEQVANTLGPLLKNTALRLQLDLPGKLEIDSYPGFFSQIIMNLVTNSLRHGYPEAPKKGFITLALSKQGNMIHLKYQDDGVGIPADLLPHIFKPFFSTGKQKGGSGLGLSIVQHLVVKQLGGSITCESVERKGVSFDIQIPVNPG
ncbi:MAG: ATP-binding protein [Bacteroidota bacterium]